jgi:hypothetical protein
VSDVDHFGECKNVDRCKKFVKSGTPRMLDVMNEKSKPSLGRVTSSQHDMGRIEKKGTPGEIRNADGEVI